MDFRFLSNSHAPQLSLFKIGCNPHFIERHHGEKLLPVLHVHPNHHCLVHFTRDRSNDFRVSEIQFGLFQKRTLLLDVRERRLHARPGRRHLLRPGLRIFVVRIGLRQAAPGLLDELFRRGLAGTGSHNRRCAGSGRG